ncbi:hypothetical protein SERLADRAFT_462364 [Serpula lacrymans var. lacrymans S7.9]|uniref:Uncharacterized protein n=1 Tax=Serpula lacrymans var. lacrymans (strain S7.9) TaxID=578457 RepID=F8NN68_SERL9|nr:uncharacterized protein SERLADRAFT_462364 [Serpula lacrymans var. lacrymans S7.9]EGO27989.1 hypothetical protein SERLADRAFT_462364 [Serpula lacrymans var. lacrymans S7.9]
MPPSLRSTGSTPTTPSKKSTPEGSLPTPKTTPRRIPHCTKCGRPRAGHPRSGCPYADEPSPSAQAQPASAIRATSASSEPIEDALQSLHIEQEAQTHGILKTPQEGGEKNKRRLSVRFALAPGETLASLSSTSSDIVERLLQPGMMGDDSSEEGETEQRNPRILRWQKSLVIPHEPAVKPDPVPPTLSSRMPGTLISPTPSLVISSQSTASDIDARVHISDSKSTVSTFTKDTASLTPSPPPRALARTMSVEERNAFVGKLTQASTIAPAMLFGVPRSNLAEEQQNARKVGFYSEVLPSDQDDQVWLILGRDEKAVELLARRFQEETKQEKKNGGRLRAAAGGVMIGAVATWSGLAFS